MVDPLHEILRSPLDDLPEPRVSGLDALVLTLALLVGIGTGWMVGAPSDPSPAVSTTTAPIPTVPLELPRGWTDTGLGYAVGVTWMYTRGPDLLVGISVANRAGTDPVTAGTTALGFDRRGIGVWTVELSGGERVTHTREMFDVNAAGVATIEFADLGATVDDVRSISLRPATGYGTRVQQVSLPIETLPARFDSIEPITATERVESTDDGSEHVDLTFVAVDHLTIDWSNAAISWTLEDTPDIRVMLQTAVTIEGDTDEPVQLATVTGGGAFLQRSFPPLSPAASGRAVLRKTSGAAGGTYAPNRAAVDITISWLRYEPDDITLGLEFTSRLDPVD